VRLFCVRRPFKRDSRHLHMRPFHQKNRCGPVECVNAVFATDSRHGYCVQQEFRYPRCFFSTPGLKTAPTFLPRCANSGTGKTKRGRGKLCCPKISLVHHSPFHASRLSRLTNSSFIGLRPHAPLQCLSILPPYVACGNQHASTPFWLDRKLSVT
jgi:hypothetical protein